MSYSKYKNRKIWSGGLKFDSKKEATRFAELQLLQLAGKIFDLQTQVQFNLIPSQYEEFEVIDKRTGQTKIKTRQAERAVNYKADFVYYLPTGEMVVEDTKGMRTKEYVIKRKLMLWIHGIRIHEI